jgi:hypothetical protein
LARTSAGVFDQDSARGQRGVCDTEEVDLGAAGDAEVAVHLGGEGARDAAPAAAAATLNTAPPWRLPTWLRTCAAGSRRAVPAVASEDSTTTPTWLLKGTPASPEPVRRE